MLLSGSLRPQGPSLSKNRHNAIAQDLVDCTLKTMDGIHHNMNGGIEEFLSVFRVEVPH
jgi:hypothetical protein